ncbi:MAG: rhomboid family intramembrane serine protease [Candidatus Aenigmatarchaeota archaeon]
MKLTLLLIVICIIAFFFTAIQPAETRESILQDYGFSGQNLAARPWTLVTSIFLHADLSHLLSNMLILLFFGIAVEHEMKAAKFLAIFFLAAFAGDLFSMLVYAPDVIGIGASAAIFGLVGAGMLVRPASMSFAPYVMPVPLGILGIMYIVYNAYGFLVAPAGEISYIAHFGGLFVGLLFGFKERGFKKGLKILILSLLALIALIAVLLLIIGFISF